MTRYCLTVACASTRGIVAVIATYLAQKGCNITDSAQFDVSHTGRFFMRVSFVSEQGVELEELCQEFPAMADPIDMDWAMQEEARRMIDVCPDITLNEMVAHLEAEQSVRIGRSTLSDWLRGHIWTFKKSAHLHWSRSIPTS